MARTMATKKTKKKQKKGKRSFSSLECHSSVSSSPKDSNFPAQEGDASKSSEMSKKAQCDLCKLSYSTEKELTEHLLSIMHHTKMEDKEEKPVHSCTLCFTTCSTMADYRLHVTTDIHQQRLSSFKGDGDKNPANNKGKQPLWRKKQKYSHQSKHGVFTGYNNQFSNKHKIKKFQGIGFKSQHKYDSSTSSQAFDAGYYRGNTFEYADSAERWPQKQLNYTRTLSETAHLGPPPVKNTTRNISDGRGLLGSQPARQCPKPWVSGFYGVSQQHRSSEGISLPWNLDQRPQRWGTDFDYQKEDHKHQKYTGYIDFASSTIPETWDEQSLLQHEEFLASIDDICYIGHQYSSQQHSSSNSSSERQRGPNVLDGKLLSGVDDQLMQDSFARTSRSVHVSPVKEAPRKQQTPSVSAERIHNRTAKVKSFGTHSHTPKHSVNNSRHERADVSKELKDTHKKAFKVDQTVLRSKNWHIPGKEVASLPHKQQSYHNVNPNISGKLQYGFDSGSEQHSNISVSFTVKHSRHFPTESAASTLQQNSGGNALDDIRKSIEKSVLDTSKEPQTKNVTASKINRKRYWSESTEPVTTNENMDVTVGKAQSKRVFKPQLTKDSIKKIINTPNSRDERLRLSRMLQSRGEHKTAAQNILRTNVQLEGLHDSTVISEDVNLDGNQNSNVEIIKLEDLSDSLRSQILDLIRNDVASFVGSQTELVVSKIATEKHAVEGLDNSNTHVILLSDDEDVINAAENDKGNSQKCSSFSTSRELIKNASKAKKKKVMIISEPVSKSGLYRSALPSVNHALMSATASIKYSGNHETTKQTEMLTKQPEGMLNACSDVNLPSCSLSVKQSRSKKLSGNKVVNDSVEAQLGKGKTSDSASLSNGERLSGNRSELSAHKIDRQVKDSVSAKDLQTCGKSPHIRKKKVKTRKPDNSSEISSSSQCSKPTLHERSCQIPDTSMITPNIERNIKSPTKHAQIKANSISKGAMVKSSTQEEIVSSSLHTDTRFSPLLSTTLRPYTPETSSDSSLPLVTQQHSIETTLSLSSPNAAKSHTQTIRRLALPPSTWLMGQTSSPRESLPSSLNASTSNKTSGEVTVITDDEDDSGAESQQLPDREENNLTQLPGASEQNKISSSDRFDDIKILSSYKPSVPLSLLADDKSEMVTTIIDDDDNIGLGNEQLPGREVNNLTQLTGASQQVGISLSDRVNDADILASSKLSIPLVLLKDEKKPEMVTIAVDDDINSRMESEHLLDSGVSNSGLPVSTLQMDGVSAADICENNPTSSGSALPSVKVEATSKMVTTVTDDDDSSGAGDKQLPDSGMENETSADVTESSSNIMSELLMLSEREEDIKQEKMSLDLRLSRLHKLLEQAVVQINKCTERRKQLHEEEHELSSQRLSLLREAASLNSHKKSSAAASNCDGEHHSQVSNTSQSTSHNLATSRSTVPCASIAQTSVVSSSTNENPQGTSLSRDDWLAKFSSYLPCGTDGEDTRSLPTRNISLASSSAIKEVIHCSSIPAASLSSLLPSDALAKEGDSHPSQMADYVIKAPQKLVFKPAIGAACLLTSQQYLPVNDKSDGNLQFQDDGSGQSSSSQSSAPIKLLPESVTTAPVIYLRNIRTDAGVGENIQTGSLSE